MARIAAVARGLKHRPGLSVQPTEIRCWNPGPRLRVKKRTYRGQNRRGSELARPSQERVSVVMRFFPRREDPHHPGRSARPHILHVHCRQTKRTRPRAIRVAVSLAECGFTSADLSSGRVLARPRPTGVTERGRRLQPSAIGGGSRTRLPHGAQAQSDATTQPRPSRRAEINRRSATAATLPRAIRPARQSEARPPASHEIFLAHSFPVVSPAPVTRAAFQTRSAHP